MFVFRKICRALFSWNTRFEIRPIQLQLRYHWTLKLVVAIKNRVMPPIYVSLLRYFVLYRIIPRFSCEKTLLKITHDRKGISLIIPTWLLVIHDYYKGIFIRFWKNVEYWICSSPRFKMGKVFWGRQINYWIFWEEIWNTLL